MPNKMTEDQKHRLLRAVKESLEQERIWRDQKAAEHGWTIHPNDMELEGAERQAMIEAFVTGKPQPEYDPDK